MQEALKYLPLVNLLGIIVFGAFAVMTIRWGVEQGLEKLKALETSEMEIVQRLAKAEADHERNELELERVRNRLDLFLDGVVKKS